MIKFLFIRVYRHILQKTFDLFYYLFNNEKDIIIIANPYKNITGHAKYLYNSLLQNKINNVFILNNFKTDISSENELSFSFTDIFFKLLKTKIIFYTHNPEDVFFIIPKNVIKVNIWHGMPIKPIGYDSKIELSWIKNKEFFTKKSPYLRNDFLIVNSENYINTFINAWKYPKDKILPLGSLIKDYLVENDNSDYLINHNLYSSIKGKKVILIAPTFRQNNFYYTLLEDLIESVTDLHKNIFIIIKLHPNDNFKLKKKLNTIQLFDEDIYDLMLLSNVLITDYSSIFNEFKYLNRPFYFFIPDYQDYISINGNLYINFEKDFREIVAYNKKDMLKLLNKEVVLKRYLHSIDRKVINSVINKFKI